jgi:hypothetical protein
MGTLNILYYKQIESYKKAGTELSKKILFLSNCFAAYERTTTVNAMVVILWLKTGKLLFEVLS